MVVGAESGLVQRRYRSWSSWLRQHEPLQAGIRERRSRSRHTTPKEDVQPWHPCICGAMEAHLPRTPVERRIYRDSGFAMSTQTDRSLNEVRTAREGRAKANGPGLATSACMSPEAFWDLHGASLYALACALLGDEAAALRSVSLAMADIYTPAGVDAEVSPEVTLRTAAACVYIRCHAGLGEIPMERTMTTPPLMVLLGELPRGQRAALSLCVFGGHTYRQAATRLNLPSEVVADLLTAGLHDFVARDAGSDPDG